MGVNGKSEKDKARSVIHETAEFRKKVLATDLPADQKKEVMELFDKLIEISKYHI